MPEISIATREKQDEILSKLGSGVTKINAAIFDTPGTHQWICPEGTEWVRLTMFGGGQGGSGPVYGIEGSVSGSSGTGGTGGYFCVRLLVKVTANQSYDLVVGSGGAGGVGINYNGNQSAVKGKAGGTSSAFDIVCIGGGSDMLPSNQKGVSIGAFPTDLKLNVVGGSPLIYGTSTPFSNPSRSNLVGAPGYGGGGSKFNTRTGNTITTTNIYPSPGAGGSGGALDSWAGEPNQYDHGQKGGDGIIIIEW